MRGRGGRSDQGQKRQQTKCANHALSPVFNRLQKPQPAAGVKARAGLHKTRTVDLDAIAAVVGTRASQAVADAVSARSITLIKDAHDRVPLKL